MSHTDQSPATRKFTAETWNTLVCTGCGKANHARRLACKGCGTDLPKKEVKPSAKVKTGKKTASAKGRTRPAKGGVLTPDAVKAVIAKQETLPEPTPILTDIKVAEATFPPVDVPEMVQITGKYIAMSDCRVMLRNQMIFVPKDRILDDLPLIRELLAEKQPIVPVDQIGAVACCPQCNHTFLMGNPTKAP